ncbi:hypothetical protein [Christensenella minuta]|uniref:helix-turn-helix transcriptional regulator n=1 Tax=Christensenella minuta TaxID=626937 RepID=UPI002A821AFC|nr:hypothetical protein [Christensenella minuta]MDY3750535.1 hypothetical protein [Christensenella minuta]
MAPTTEEIRAHDPTVPVPVAAAYLGITPQSVREGMKEGDLPIGIKRGNRFYIYPDRLIAYRCGDTANPETDKRAVVSFLQKLIEAVEGTP